LILLLILQDIQYVLGLGQESKSATTSSPVIPTGDDAPSTKPSPSTLSVHIKYSPNIIIIIIIIIIISPYIDFRYHQLDC